jgi:formylglycine-generating enzyme required for sulfatase activity
MKAWNDGAGWWPPAGSGKHTHLNGGRGLANGDGSGRFEPGWSPADNPQVLPMTTPCDPYFATWTATPGAQENLPINCVNWYGAYAFCTWDGGFLPSQAEWELAAAGGHEQREYPWGSTDPGAGSQYAIYGCYYPLGSPSSMAGANSTCTGVVNIAPVGAALLGESRWGQLDLVGNMSEWLIDWDTDVGFQSPCTDCATLTPIPPGPSTAGYKAASAGCHLSGKPTLLPGNIHGGALAANPFAVTGFRCARAPLP